ncbi:MAG: NAD-dependent epimerase/dehydratase family protein [Oceanococcus sp.]
MTTPDQNIPHAPEFSPTELGKTCLVTGGGGYLGSAIVRRLRQHGCKVVSLDIQEHDHADDGVLCIAADLRHYDAVLAACKGVDTIFHTAAIISLLTYFRPAQKRLAYDVNCLGTQNVVKAAQQAGVATLVHTSSFNVVLDRVLEEQDESVPYAKKTADLYSLTKIEAEQTVLQADQVDGLRTCAVRPGGIWGPDCDSMMIKSFLTELAAGNFKVLIGDKRATMDNTHIDNLIDAQFLAAKALRTQPDQVGGQAYFITDNERVNGLHWFRPLAEALGETFPKVAIPAGVMKLVSRGMELAHFFGGPEPALTYRGIRNLTESSSFRIDKARKELGYEPRYTRHNGFPQLLPLAREFVDKQRTAAA